MELKQEILLVEYKEATQACRQNENLVRTGMSIFVAMEAGIISFIDTRQDISMETLLLGIFSVVTCLVTFITIIRLQKLYSYYIEYAKCIENKLNMNLYSTVWDKVTSDNTIGNKIGNKKLLSFIPATGLIIYLILLIRDRLKYFNCIL